MKNNVPFSVGASGQPTPEIHAAVEQAFAQAEKASHSRELDEFFDGVRRCFEAITAGFETDDNNQLLNSLEARMKPVAGRARLQSIVQLACLPVFDKPLLASAREPGERLWLTAMPMVVTFDPSVFEARIDYEDLPIAELLKELEGAVTDRTCRVRMLPALHTRDSLVREGPSALAMLAVQSEMGLGEMPQASCELRFEQAWSGWNTAVIWLLIASRQSVTSLDWGFDASRLDLERLGNATLRSLSQAELPVTDVRFFAPGALANAYLNPIGPYTYELDCLVARAKAEGARKLVLRQSHTDYLELYADDGEGPWGLLPPTTYAIPHDEVVRRMQALAKYHELGFSFQRHQQMGSARH